MVSGEEATLVPANVIGRGADNRVGVICEVSTPETSHPSGRLMLPSLPSLASEHTECRGIYVAENQGPEHD